MFSTYMQIFRPAQAKQMGDHVPNSFYGTGPGTEAGMIYIYIYIYILSQQIIAKDVGQQKVAKS